MAETNAAVPDRIGAQNPSDGSKTKASDPVVSPKAA